MLTSFDRIPLPFGNDVLNHLDSLLVIDPELGVNHCCNDVIVEVSHDTAVSIELVEYREDGIAVVAVLEPEHLEARVVSTLPVGPPLKEHLVCSLVECHCRILALLCSLACCMAVHMLESLLVSLCVEDSLT